MSTATKRPNTRAAALASLTANAPVDSTVVDAGEKVEKERAAYDNELEQRAIAVTALVNIGCATAGYQHQLFRETLERRNSHADMFNYPRVSEEEIFS